MVQFSEKYTLEINSGLTKKDINELLQRVLAEIHSKLTISQTDVDLDREQSNVDNLNSIEKFVQEIPIRYDWNIWSELHIIREGGIKYIIGRENKALEIDCDPAIHQDMMNIIDQFQFFVRNWYSAITRDQTPFEYKPSKKRGMRSWRQARANLFIDIKDKNPNLTYEKVAERATDIINEKIRLELKEKHPKLDDERIGLDLAKQFRNDYNPGKEHFTAEDVRNDFRAMGRKWHIPS